MVYQPLNLERSPFLPSPNPGPQAHFVGSDADIVIYGGAAFGGKTTAMLIYFDRCLYLPGHQSVIFRRENYQITSSGGIWDCARDLYRAADGFTVSDKTHEILGPQGSTLRFACLQTEEIKRGWQVHRIGIEELTQFNLDEFMFLTHGLPGGQHAKIRATCTADPDSWLVRDQDGVWGNGLISWWINPRTGKPMPERSGVVRWLALIDEKPVFGNPNILRIAGLKPRSLTFIPAIASDNPHLANNPECLKALRSLGSNERIALLEGSWSTPAE